MPRHSRQQYDRLQHTLQRVRERFADSPLSVVGKKLEELITGSREAMLREGAEPRVASQVADYVDHAMENLPQSFGDRFYFDAAMIQAVTEEWGQGHVHLSRMIMPRHNNRDWGHQRIMMPSEDRKNTHTVDLIRFPGEDNLDDINLSAYPWLYHELGHNLLFRDDATFRTSFEFGLNQITNALRLAGVADRGQARSNAHRTIDDVRHKWQPTPDHHNWAHELATDLIALWTCGPAYLATFQGIFEDPTINPYKIDQNHPPYAVRAAALISAG